jgi:hypothetical protein
VSNNGIRAGVDRLRDDMRKEAAEEAHRAVVFVLDHNGALPGNVDRTLPTAHIVSICVRKLLADIERYRDIPRSYTEAKVVELTAQVERLKVELEESA